MAPGGCAAPAGTPAAAGGPAAPARPPRRTKPETSAPEPAATPASDIPAWCGTKEITLSVSDGFGGNNWRRITSGEAAAGAQKCPNVKEYIYTDGQGDTQK